MAFNSLLRRATKSVLPLATRSVSSPRTFHSTISPALVDRKQILTRELGLPNFLSAARYATAAGSSPTADGNFTGGTDSGKPQHVDFTRNSGLKNESSKTKRLGLFQRTTAAALLPLMIMKNVSSTFFANILLFSHINEGIKEIMADYVHHEVTRNFVLVCLRLFLIIVVKDVFVALFLA